jgi:hypothetical protein
MRRWFVSLVFVLCLLASSTLAQQAANLRNQIWGHLVVTINDHAAGRQVDARCYLTDATSHHWTPSGALTYVKPPEEDFISWPRLAQPRRWNSGFETTVRSR